MSNEWISDIGTINKSKKGKLYIKVDKDFSVKAGDILNLKSKKEEIQSSADAGKITQERADELMKKLEFIKYTIHQPPRGE